MGDGDSELLCSYLYLTGDHCWISMFGQQALNILTSYLFHCGLRFLEWDSGSSFSNTSAACTDTHTSLIYEKEVLKQWQYFFFFKAVLQIHVLCIFLWHELSRKWTLSLQVPPKWIHLGVNCSHSHESPLMSADITLNLVMPQIGRSICLIRS